MISLEMTGLSAYVRHKSEMIVNGARKLLEELIVSSKNSPINGILVVRIEHSRDESGTDFNNCWSWILLSDVGHDTQL